MLEHVTTPRFGTPPKLTIATGLEPYTYLPKPPPLSPSTATQTPAPSKATRGTQAFFRPRLLSTKSSQTPSLTTATLGTQASPAPPPPSSSTSTQVSPSLLPSFLSTSSQLAALVATPAAAAPAPATATAPPATADATTNTNPPPTQQRRRAADKCPRTRRLPPLGWGGRRPGGVPGNWQSNRRHPAGALPHPEGARRPPAATAPGRWPARPRLVWVPKRQATSVGPNTVTKLVASQPCQFIPVG